MKLSPVYMDGKGKYKQKEKEVKSLISQYSKVSKGNKSKVIYCLDCDECDSKSEDLTFLKTVKKYCDDRGYDFIWFCKDVEQVYIGKRVDKPLFITIRKHLVKRAVKHFFYGNTFHSCHFRIAVAKNEIHTTTVRHGINAIVADIYNVAAAYDNSLADTQKILLRQSR